MVASEDDPLRRQTDPIRDPQHLAPELDRGHACVSALVVHLVAGGFDQHGAAVRGRLQHRRFDHERVCGADGGDADGLALGVGDCESVEWMQAQDGPVAVLAMNAVSSASVEVPSIGPRTQTARAPQAFA